MNTLEFPYFLILVSAPKSRTISKRFTWVFLTIILQEHNLSSRSTCRTVDHDLAQTIEPHTIPFSVTATLWELPNQEEGPLLSIQRPAFRISFYSNGARIHDERWSLARLLLSKWRSSAIDGCLPSGWEVGGQGEWKGMIRGKSTKTPWPWEGWRQAAPFTEMQNNTKTLQTGWSGDRSWWENLRTLNVFTAAVVRQGPQENSPWQHGRD